jgi:hypothetical protein
MKMTPLNIGLFSLAIVIGIYIGLSHPMIGLLLLIPVVVLVIFILMRNKSGALASAEESADALTMNVLPGKARIYVMRKGFVGGQQGMDISIDGQLSSQIRTKYFLMAEVEPGVHQITAKMASGTGNAARIHEVRLSAGEAILLDMKLNMGLVQGTPDFTEITDISEAKQMLQGCRLVGWKEIEGRSPASISA